MAFTEIVAPSTIKYPVTIRNLFPDTGEEVRQGQPLFSYFISDKSEIKYFRSNSDCILEEWMIKEGCELEEGQELARIKIICDHPVRFGGLCGKCGLDLETVRTDQDESDNCVPIDHNYDTLCVNSNEAARLDLELTERLLFEERLSLIVDLDQTVIHVTVDPKISNWKSDSENVNYNVLKDVTMFELSEDQSAISNKTTYYVKQRPRLRKFLNKMVSMFEMHVYTMGTKAYAREIAKIIDPDGKFFGDRILSRNESGSLTRKRLSRLFPFNTSMVVIIDDRADVWSWSPNLVKVPAFEFFIGIGDINNTQINAKTESCKINNECQIEDSQESALEIKANRVLENGSNAQNLAFPELQSTKIEDSEDLSYSTQNVDEKVEHTALKDDDKELESLSVVMTTIHHAFYGCYRRKLLKEGGSLEHPDIREIIINLRSRVFEGLIILFSGIIPLGQKAKHSEIGKLAAAFGAKIAESLDDRPTHLVAERKTSKVRSAFSWGNIFIVSRKWLLDSIALWERQDESSYLFFKELKVNRNLPKAHKLCDYDSLFESINLESISSQDINKLQQESSIANQEIDLNPDVTSTNFADLDWDKADEEIDEALAEDDFETEHNFKRKQENKRLKLDNSELNGDDVQPEMDKSSSSDLSEFANELEAGLS